MNKKIPLSGLLAAFALACLLGGCSGPSLVLSVASQPNVNPDHSGRPSPVLVTLYELRGELAFKQADFPSLFANPVQTLGADLVFMTELVFVPGEARRVEFQPHADARFVGVAAEFRQMERALWRMAKPMNPEKRNILALELNDVSLLAVPEEAAAKWSP
ncbi:MAG: type VI secretion system lipoprotein TssJ, partial [Deltaproteobacteria bacterium]|nr:type VI secretion system lipoprotein TssJ [Deltaproteobacteria bacterium]